MSYDPVSLDFVYFPVAGLLWLWHRAFGWIFGPGNGLSWALAVMFLVFTIRAFLLRGVVRARRTTRKMSALQPQIKALQRKYGKDRQKMAQEMQKLQREHGFNPVLMLLPMLVQIPVFIGLYHVVRSFNRTGSGPTSLGLDFISNATTPNYVFGVADVQSFLQARLIGVPLSAAMTTSAQTLQAFGPFGGIPDRLNIIALALGLMLGSAALTHANARLQVRGQSPETADTPQTLMTNRLALYVFPLGILASGAFLHIAVLIYFLSNNLWTYGQNHYLAARPTADPPWPRLDAQAYLTASERTAPFAVRSHLHARYARRALDAAHHHRAYAHSMAAGAAAEAQLGPADTVVIGHYLLAADIARFQRQKRAYHAAIAKVSPHVQPVVSDRTTTAGIDRSLIARYLFVTIGAKAVFSRRSTAAAEARGQLTWLRRLFGVVDRIPSATEVSAMPHDFGNLAFIATFAVSDPQSSRASQQSAAVFAMTVGLQLITPGRHRGAAGPSERGRELIAATKRAVRASSGGTAVWEASKTLALDYVKAELGDAAFELAAPVLEAAINAVGDGVSAAIGVVQSI